MISCTPYQFYISKIKMINLELAQSDLLTHLKVTLLLEYLASGQIIEK